MFQQSLMLLETEKFTLLVLIFPRINFCAMDLKCNFMHITFRALTITVSIISCILNFRQVYFERSFFCLCYIKQRKREAKMVFIIKLLKDFQTFKYSCINFHTHTTFTHNHCIDLCTIFKN